MSLNKKEETEAQNEIIKKYLKCVQKNKSFPSASELQSNGVTQSAVRHYFGNMTKLHEYVEDNYTDDLDKFILTEKTLFTHKKHQSLQKELKKFKRFFITTVVSGKSVDVNFLNSAKNYCELNNGTLLLLPCADVASRSKSSSWNFDPVIAGENIVFDDVAINENLFLNSIKLSAKHINPLTGLSRIGQRNGSFIYASPKQFLEYTATSPLKSKIPHAIMTTGAMTFPDYKTDKYMSERTSVIAENDHVMGALIVEVRDNKKFHFRQIQADADGSFIDLGKEYTADSVKKVTSNFVLGDWHSGATDEDVVKGFKKLSEEIEINDLIAHDFFDGYCISHHDMPYPLKRARKELLNLASLEEELRQGTVDINFLLSLVKGKLVMVKSNHDEVLNRYLQEARYIHDPKNHFIALDLAREMLKNNDPLKYAYETYGGEINDPDRIIWLQRDEEYKIGNVECGQHGDLGANGSRGSLDSVERAYGNCIVGHSHSAAIKRGVFRVGTSSRTNLDYNRGPSSWTHTGCFVYDNGSRQLINFIDGDYTI